MTKSQILKSKGINLIPEYRPLGANRFDLEILCSVCQKRAIAFLFDREERTVSIRSAQRGYKIRYGDTEELEEELKRGKYKKLHQFLLKNDWDGLDYYCPKCNRIYCLDHFPVIPIFDGFFYDYAIGRCPVGHERIVDD